MSSESAALTHDAKSSAKQSSGKTNHAAAERKPGSHLRRFSAPSGGLVSTHVADIPRFQPTARIPLQRKLAVGSVNDPLEAQADSIAARVMSSAGGMAHPAGHVNPTLQRKCACESSGTPCESCSAKKEKLLRQSTGAVAPVTAPPVVHEALQASGSPLDSASRAFMEPRFGYDFSRVRVHTDDLAARSAASVSAAAFTVGSNVVFSPGKYAPHTSAGQHLLAHELAHVVQQSSTNHAAVMRQPAAKPLDCNAPEPEVARPTTQGSSGPDLTLTPGPLRSEVLGSPVPLPGSLTLTGDVVNPKYPRFQATLSPRGLVGGVLENIDLSVSRRSGTPPNAKPDASNESKITLVNPSLSFDPGKGQLHGRAVLSIGGDYPPELKEPTEIDVEIESSELGKFSGEAAYGPLHADFKLSLHYDSDRLERALLRGPNAEGGFSGFWENLQQILVESVPGINLTSVSAALQSTLQSLISGKIAGGDFAERITSLLGKNLPAGANLKCLKKYLSQFASEVTHPGFTLGGGLSLFGHRISKFSASAPTTKPLAHPLLNAPAKFPLSTRASGVIVAPPGAISSTAVPALGYTSSSYNEKRGTSITAAALPTVSPSAISAGESPLKEFPVIAYAEISHVRRINKNLELGVRATLSLSTDIFGGKSSAATSASDQAIEVYKDYRRATLLPGYDPPDLLAPGAPPPSDPRERVRDMHDPTAADRLPPGIDGASAPLIGVSIFGRWGN